MIVLDTHVWIWWASDPDRLSPAASAAVDAAEGIGISAISAWEVAMLADRGRLGLDRPAALWVRAALAGDSRLTELPLTAGIAARSVALGADGMHGDAADRFIVATARAHDAVLVTRDEAIRAFDPAGTVW